MNEERWKRYEAKKAELKKTYAARKRKIFALMLVLVAVFVTAIVLLWGKLDIMVILIGGGLCVALSIIFCGQQIYQCRVRENTQLQLLEQEEPFERFQC